MTIRLQLRLRGFSGWQTRNGPSMKVRSSNLFHCFNIAFSIGTHTLCSRSHHFALGTLTGDIFSTVYFPVFNTFDTSTRETVGIMRMVIHWARYFTNL